MYQLLTLLVVLILILFQSTMNYLLACLTFILVGLSRYFGGFYDRSVAPAVAQFFERHPSSRPVLEIAPEHSRQHQPVLQVLIQGLHRSSGTSSRSISFPHWFCMDCIQ